MYIWFTLHNPWVARHIHESLVGLSQNYMYNQYLRGIHPNAHVQWMYIKDY
jgi:hypothetical protein